MPMLMVLALGLGLSFAIAGEPVARAADGSKPGASKTSGAGNAVGPAGGESLRHKQEAQQRARAMARELISSILDIQLKQLKENGLDKLPIHGEIASMRENIDKLIGAEMAEVVDLLVEAQSLAPAERKARVGEAREKIREIVIRLSVERQNLLRRLKVAELSAQTRRLIQLEKGVLRVTESIPEQPRLQQETLTLGASQDQRDVKALFARLVDTLADVSAWVDRSAPAPPMGFAFSKPPRSASNSTPPRPSSTTPNSTMPPAANGPSSRACRRCLKRSSKRRASSAPTTKTRCAWCRPS